VSFEVSADAYGRFMGRFSEPLAVQMCELLDVREGQRALDVGCGPGALTAQLVRRLGLDAVAAVDPSPPFLAAVRQRLPGLDVKPAVAEDLPYDDGSFDLALAQLVVHFMTDPVAGLAEMARVTRPDGMVAATVWDLTGGRAPLSDFWRGAGAVDPVLTGESRLPGTAQGQLDALFASAGLTVRQSTELSVRSRFFSFEEWWEPYTFGVGPAGEYVARLDPERRAEVRESCRALLPDPPFEITGVAWCVVGGRSVPT
jgi:SAM-dependent methyltransferase